MLKRTDLRPDLESIVSSLMEDWIRLASVSDCPPGKAIECVAADRIVALFNVNGRFFALDGICPHQGGPLGKGVLIGCLVTCPWHGWQFDVTTGQHQTSQSLVHPQFEVRVAEEAVWVRMPPAAG
jgi:nitrite reductase (NADH) small subunit